MGDVVDPKTIEQTRAEARRLADALHALIDNGQGDTDEADSIREQLVDTLERLPTVDRNELNDYSGDLWEAREKRGFADPIIEDDDGDPW